tara:strand:+ start:961 stop:1701 length:741 start_codon:yes stop_codon:yes gene_type:complete
MGKLSFENFGYVSNKSKNFTISSSRYLHMQKYEKIVLKDIMSKLSVKPTDVILDIGCNVGMHLMPLFFFVDKIYGNDHKKCLETLKNRFPEFPNSNLIPGNFLDLKVRKKFSKILCYSVLHYLKNEKEVLFFVEKALKILKKGGIIMLGDIPNQNLESNFLKSKIGKKWTKKFNSERIKSKKKNEIESISYYLKNKKKDNSYVTINNSLIKNLISKLSKKVIKIKRFKHPLNFPHGQSREDIIIYK